MNTPAEREARSGTAQVFAFPRCRAPLQDAEDAGSLDNDRNVLKDVNVLIVEDDFIVAFDMQSLLEERGARVVGPAANLEEARALVTAQSAEIHAAILDVNLSGQYVFPLAIELQRAGIALMFATAYADDDRLFPDDLKDAPRLAKPVLPNVLVGRLKRLLG